MYNQLNFQPAPLLESEAERDRVRDHRVPGAPSVRVGPGAGVRIGIPPRVFQRPSPRLAAPRFFSSRFIPRFAGQQRFRFVPRFGFTPRISFAPRFGIGSGFGVGPRFGFTPGSGFGGRRRFPFRWRWLSRFGIFPGSTGFGSQSDSSELISWAQGCLAQSVDPSLQQTGFFNAETRRAIAAFQSQQQMAPTGVLNSQTINALEQACNPDQDASSGDSGAGE